MEVDTLSDEENDDGAEGDVPEESSLGRLRSEIVTRTRKDGHSLRPEQISLGVLEQVLKMFGRLTLEQVRYLFCV